jgi:hypothetical protein
MWVEHSSKNILVKQIMSVPVEVNLQTNRAHLFWYLGLYYYHWVATSAGGL